MSPDKETWVRLLTTMGITPAEMIVKRLQAANIPAAAAQQGAGAALGLTIGPLGTAVVMVPESFLTDARQLLDLEEPLDSEDLIFCPECGANLILDNDEWEAGEFTCPECDATVDIDSL